MAGAFARRAAADLISDADLAYARLLVGAELLGRRLLRSRDRRQAVRRARRSSTLKRALFNEQEHYDSVATILNDAGQPPAVAADIDFAYPKGSFASKAAIASLGVTLETIFLGAYLGAVGGLPVLRAQTAVRADRGQRGAASERLHRAHRPRPGRHLVSGTVVDRRGVRCLGRVHQLAGGETVPREFYSASEAARTLGISLDTLAPLGQSGADQDAARSQQPPHRAPRKRSIACGATRAPSITSARETG